MSETTTSPPEELSTQVRASFGYCCACGTYDAHAALCSCCGYDFRGDDAASEASEAE